MAKCKMCGGDGYHKMSCTNTKAVIYIDYKKLTDPHGRWLKNYKGQRSKDVEP